jgi:hypothetical protein
MIFLLIPGVNGQISQMEHLQLVFIIIYRHWHVWSIPGYNIIAIL